MKTKASHKLAATQPAPKASPPSSTKNVWFRIKRPNTKWLVLVGSFTQWEAQPIPLAESEPGIWEVEVKLPNERYEYLYVADDGVWLEDPEAAVSVANPFGGCNSVIDVTQL